METVRFARRQMLCRPGDKVVAMYNVERRCAVVRVIEVTEDLLDAPGASLDNDVINVPVDGVPQE